MANEPAFLGISAGDWLQAAATVITVICTILGTLYIERKNREAAEIEDVNRIAEVVTTMQQAASSICAGLPDDATNYQHYAKSLNMQTALKTALDMYHCVRADTKVKDLKLWRSLRVLDDILRAQGETIEREIKIFNNDGHHTAVFNLNRQKVMAAAEPIANAAQEVLAVAAN